MGDDKYGGWENRETWALNLWLSNDEGLYNLVKERLNEIDSSKKFEHELWDGLEELVDELKEEAENNKELKKMFDDVGSLWRVNWEEIAKAFMEE